jgi:hypothetical protein
MHEPYWQLQVSAFARLLLNISRAGRKRVFCTGWWLTFSNPFWRAIFSSIRRRAGIAASNRKARCGAVAFIQRFSDALHLSPHFHVISLDGIYCEKSEGELMSPLIQDISSM